jgi:Integrase core domain
MWRPTIVDFAPENHLTDIGASMPWGETLFKTELTWRTSFQSRRQAEHAIARYIDGIYNPIRRHSALGYKSPLKSSRMKQTKRQWLSTNRGQVHRASVRRGCGGRPRAGWAGSSGGGSDHGSRGSSGTVPDGVIPPPVEPEAFAIPLDHSCWFDQREAIMPSATIQLRFARANAGRACSNPATVRERARRWRAVRRDRLASR